MRDFERRAIEAFSRAGAEAGLAVLVEVHDEARTGPRPGHRRAKLIGVNNRDLDTFKVDLGTTERLAGESSVA